MRQNHNTETSKLNTEPLEPTTETLPNPSPEVFDALTLRSVRNILCSFLNALKAHSARINNLNVYPVPDGDTGTNMTLTLQSVVDELADSKETSKDTSTGSANQKHFGTGSYKENDISEDDINKEDFAELTKAVSYAALMGARGNSGVIMAQVLRGIIKELQEANSADKPLNSRVLAGAFSTATKQAYGAVGNPVEGTILTVLREASEAAQAAADNNSNLLKMFQAAHTRGYKTLARTPEMLQVLADAGVIDAGGAGLMLLFDAVLAELGSHKIPTPDTMPGSMSGTTTTPGSMSDTASDMNTDAAHPQTTQAQTTPSRAQQTSGHHHDHESSTQESSIADLRYEVMFLLDADDSAIEGFKNEWSTIGDSIAIIGGDGIWNCHIHTDAIGASIEAAIAVGRPHRIQVTDLLEQVAEQHDEHTHQEPATPKPIKQKSGQTEQQKTQANEQSKEHSSSTPLIPMGITEPHKCSVVAVGVGKGIEAMLMSMGVSRVVSGGASMNPSTAELLAAVDSLSTGEVVILPNNSNIIAVAEQLDAVTERNVSVVPTTNVLEGIASLMAFSSDNTSSVNSHSMSSTSADTTTGEVTRAVRDSVSTIGAIKTGDWIGVGPNGVVVITQDETQAVIELFSALLNEQQHELLTILTGTDANEASIAAVEAHIANQHPDLEVEIHDGGQPLYPYYIGLV
ncbi:MAG: DAK2 domain-containing protein [Acidimicrobiaceae bacterium]|nr:DAK2 domain-containing protein [Acidimicrobiaceae bacterium]